MRFAIVFLGAIACFGQGTYNLTGHGVLDAHGMVWRFPESTRAGLPIPAATNAGWRYTVTDCLEVSCTAGGGSIVEDLRSDGSLAWVVISGASSSSQASIFSAGTQVQRSVQCASGITNSAALTAAATSQEITIQTGISGNVRWEHATVSETTQFTGTTGLTVSMGRPGGADAEMTGGAVALMLAGGDANVWATRPVPPQLTGTYSLVLNFAVTSGNVNAATGGALTWEVCGYVAR